MGRTIVARRKKLGRVGRNARTTTINPSTNKGSQGKAKVKRESSVHEPLYMPLDDPASARKKLLLSSKALLELLGQQESIQQRRIEKKKILNQFSRTKRELSQLLSKLNEFLPKRHIQLRTAPALTVDSLPATASKKEKVSALSSELSRIDEALGMLKE